MELLRCTVGPVSTNCYIVYEEDRKKALIVDPGDEGEVIDKRLKDNGLEPAAILLTHGHFDHMMAAGWLKARYALPVYAALAEKELLLDPSRNLTGPWGGNPISFPADVWLSDGERTKVEGMEFEMLLTPGHTPGSCCYYFPKDNILLCGDTLFAGSYGRVDLPGGSSKDMLRSISRLFAKIPDDVTAFPGHGDETNMGWEKKHNPLLPYLNL